MTAKHLQYLLAAIFLILGLWALLFPGLVEALVLKPDYYMGTLSSAVLVGCFGAQAVLCSILILCTRFTARSFLVFGVCASVPFFIFNYYFVFIVPVFNQWMMLDFLGNLAILLCGLAGWQLTLREQNTTGDPTP